MLETPAATKRDARMRHAIIALDLDGTALDAGGALRERTRSAVAQATAAGVAVVLVTGRHHTAVRPFHAELALTTPAVCCNGAYVFDFAADAVIVGDPMTSSQARWLLRTCREGAVHAMIYTDAAMTFETFTPHLRRLTAWAATCPPPLRPDIRQVASFDHVIDEARAIWKFVVSHGDPRVLAAWRERAESNPDFSIEFSWTDRLDAVRAGASKGRRLIEWAASRGVAPAAIVAFGDNQNDLSMIEAAGLGVAMGNGEDELKAKADLVIGDNDSDSLGETIEGLL